MKGLHYQKLHDYIVEQVREGNKKEYDTENKREYWYSLSRPVFTNYFHNKEQLTHDDLVLLVWCAYSWMPTIPKVHWEQDKVETLSEETMTFLNYLKWIKRNEVVWEDGESLIDTLNDEQSFDEGITSLKKFINNSDVWVSKVLHFINADIFPIYDSRVMELIEEVTGETVDFNDFIDTTFKLSNDLNMTMEELDMVLWLD